MSNHSSTVRKGERSGVLVKNKRAMFQGVLMVITFLIVLVVMFSPIFKGENALRAADRLFNSIAKGSTHHIPSLLKKNDAYMGRPFSVTLQFPDKQMAQNAATILTTSGAAVTAAGEKVNVKGDLGKVLASALQDSDKMFANDAQAIEKKYGLAGKEALFVWWNLLNETDRDLTRQKLFKEASFVSTVLKKGVEVGYNFFGIVPQTARSRSLRLALSLVFYVVYTLWWGVGILMIFEGFGLEMKAGAKKEV